MESPGSARPLPLASATSVADLPATKVLAGGAEQNLQQLLKQNFDKVANVKPGASRADSSEKFVIAQGFRGVPATPDEDGDDDLAG